MVIYHANSVGTYVLWWVTITLANAVATPTHAQMARGCSLLTPTNASHPLYLFLSHIYSKFFRSFTPQPHTHTETNLMQTYSFPQLEDHYATSDALTRLLQAILVAILCHPSLSYLKASIWLTALIRHFFSC